MPDLLLGAPLLECSTWAPSNPIVGMRGGPIQIDPDRHAARVKEKIMKQYGAEFIGTFWLVLGGCGRAGRFPAKQLFPYIWAQVIGAVVAGGVLFLIASGKPGFDVAEGFAANGYDSHSPGGFSLVGALISESVMTARVAPIVGVLLGAAAHRLIGTAKE
jgi:glycerol uptake facilitator-like aquaporin